MILIDKGRLYMNTISVEELEKIDSSKITIVDVRPADQYSRGSFPGAVNIPLDEFEERMESVDRRCKNKETAAGGNCGFGGCQ